MENSILYDKDNLKNTKILKKDKIKKNRIGELYLSLSHGAGALKILQNIIETTFTEH